MTSLESVASDGRLWLSELVTATTSGEVPQSVIDAGLSNFVYAREGAPSHEVAGRAFVRWVPNRTFRWRLKSRNGGKVPDAAGIVRGRR
jgi:hypothetical protein